MLNALALRIEALALALRFGIDKASDDQKLQIPTVALPNGITLQIIILYYTLST